MSAGLMSCVRENSPPMTMENSGAASLSSKSQGSMNSVAENERHTHKIRLPSACIHKSLALDIKKSTPNTHTHHIYTSSISEASVWSESAQLLSVTNRTKSNWTENHMAWAKNEIFFWIVEFSGVLNRAEKIIFFWENFSHLITFEYSFLFLCL